MNAIVERASPLAIPKMTREEAEKTASWMATEFAEATKDIRAHLLAAREATLRLRAAFTHPDDSPWSNNFGFGIEHDGHRDTLDSGAEKAIAGMFMRYKRKAWRIIVNRLGITNVMSVAERRKFEDQLDKGDLPELTPEVIMGFVLQMTASASSFAQEAAREVFEILRPASRKHKTNDAFRVGRRVILSGVVQRRWDKGYRVSHHSEPRMVALDAVFHTLDGKGIMRIPKGPLCVAIEAAVLRGEQATGETEYFRFRCCKNGNLHLEMRRLDLVMELNRQASGDYVLGDDGVQV